MLKIGINGFGRIGRQFVKAVREHHPDTLQGVAINDLFDVQTNARLFKYDTTYGTFGGQVEIRGDEFIVNGFPIKSFSERDPVSIHHPSSLVRPLLHGITQCYIQRCDLGMIYNSGS